MTDEHGIKKFLSHLAEESGKNILKYFRKEINVEMKEDESPVTIADKSTEEILREIIMKEYPEHGILGEEFENHNSGAEYTWVLDPIDGTRSFISGAPLFGTLIALLRNGNPEYGMINLPALNECLTGNNKKAEMNGKEVRIRNCESIDKAVLLATDHLHIHQMRNGEAFDSLVKNVQFYRTWGDCFGYYLLAAGFADIMIDAVVSDWDYLPVMPIMKGAGAVITDYYGNDPIGGEGIIAANKSIHSEVIKALNP